MLTLGWCNIFNNIISWRFSGYGNTDIARIKIPFSLSAFMGKYVCSRKMLACIRVSLLLLVIRDARCPGYQRCVWSGSYHGYPQVLLVYLGRVRVEGSHCCIASAYQPLDTIKLPSNYHREMVAMVSTSQNYHRGIVAMVQTSQNHHTYSYHTKYTFAEHSCYL